MSNLNGKSHLPIPAITPVQTVPIYIQYQQKAVSAHNHGFGPKAIIEELEKEKIEIQCSAVTERLRASRAVNFLEPKSALRQSALIARIDREEKICVNAISKLIADIRGGLLGTGVVEDPKSE